MKCPFCNNEIPGILCPQCKQTIPDQSVYCLHCGAKIENDCLHDTELTDIDEIQDLDMDNRIPCDDGNCIGIIVNGKCNICQTPYRGDENQ